MFQAEENKECKTICGICSISTKRTLQLYTKTVFEICSKLSIDARKICTFCSKLSIRRVEQMCELSY